MEPTEALYSAAISTFESLAFAFAEPAREEDVDGAVAWAATARVTFTGPWDGMLTIRLDANALSAVAGNMLGSDGAPAPALQRDALGELANVICGNVLPLVAGAGPIFSLAAPRLEDGHAAAGAFDARAFLRIESGFAELLLNGAGAAAPAAP